MAKIGLITIIIIALIIVAFGSRQLQSKKNKVSYKDMSLLVSQLSALGYYHYTDASLVDELQADAIASGYLYDDETQRIYMTDAEDLAEGLVEPFFDDIAPFLAMQHVNVEQIEFTDTGDTYELNVNGDRFTIYDRIDDEGEEEWALVPERVFQSINLLLQAAGSNERIYTLYGGNDLFVVFLTEDMFKAIQQATVIETNEKPAAVRSL